MEGKYWYAAYLNSEQWQKTKQKAWNRLPKKKRCCAICKTTNPNFYDYHHYRGYGAVGATRDAKNIVPVHPACHRRCHFIFGVFKVPLTPVWLYSRYLYLKFEFWIRRLWT